MSCWAISDACTCTSTCTCSCNCTSTCEAYKSQNIKMEDINEFLQISLMNSILLYSTVGISSSTFERPDIIEKIHSYYLSKLHRYLKFRFGEIEATNQLSNGMKIVAMAREAQSIWSQRLPI